MDRYCRARTAWEEGAPKSAIGWAMALVALLLTGPLCAEDDLDRALKAEQAGMDSLKAKVAADRERLKRTQVAQQTAAESLDRLEREIARIRAEHRDLQRRERELAGRVGNTRQKMGQVGEQLELQQAGMARRLREMYKQGRRGALQVLFSSATFTDALRRLRYLSRVAEQDRREYNAIRASRRRIGEIFSLQRVQHARQRSLLAAKQEAEGALKARVAERGRELQRLQADAAARAEAIRENQKAIDRSNERVQALIQEIQKRQRYGQRLAELPPFDFEARQGKLRWPVSGKVVTRFGRHQDPELKTWTFNRGMNVAAPEDTDVRSVAPGEVVLVDWYPGYGQFVLLRHPDSFYTLYGHLAWVHDVVAVGEILDEGAVLGTVGSTGRLDGKPQLHFEIMRGEEPLDPAVWLER